MNRITIVCFGASYAVALALEVLQLFWPRPVQRYLTLGFASAGLLAHTLYLLAQPLALASQFGPLLFLAWILAVFYLYGSIHHRQLAWGVFVLPLVLGLIALAGLPSIGDEGRRGRTGGLAGGERFWIVVHGSLLLLAAVGICVGFRGQRHVPRAGAPTADQGAARPRRAAAQPGTAGGHESPGHHTWPSRC